MSRRNDRHQENQTAGICTCKHQTSTESDHEEVSHWCRRGYGAPAQDVHTIKESDQRKQKTAKTRLNVLVRLIQVVITPAGHHGSSSSPRKPEAAYFKALSSLKKSSPRGKLQACCSLPPERPRKRERQKSHLREWWRRLPMMLLRCLKCALATEANSAS